MSLCFLLAAGEGRRLRPITEARPKPCLEFLTLPLASYGFYLAQKGGFNQFLMNKHHLPDQIEELADYFKSFADSVETVDETKKLLGSGGALWNARKILEKHEFFLIANGDEVMIPANSNILKALKQKFQMDNALCTLLTCDHPDLLKTLKAVWVDSKAEVRGFGMEYPEEGLQPVHYTGYKIFSRRILDKLPEGESNIFYDIIKEAIAQGEKVTTLHMTHGHWHETGNIPSFLEASNETAKSCWNEIESRITWFKKRPLLKIETDEGLIVRPDNLKEKINGKGLIVIGENVRLGPGASIENSVVESGAILSSAIKETIHLRD